MNRVTVETAATQVLDGAQLGTGGKTQCTDCDRTVREGDEVGVYARRTADAVTFATPRVFCRQCRPATVEHPTLGAPELIVYGRLAVTSDEASRMARLTLRELELAAHSPADEGVEA